MMKGFRSGPLGSLEFWGINTLPHRLFHRYVQFPIFRGLLKKQGLAEAARVLKPQGVLLMNELSHAWSGWDELTDGLESAGFVVLESRKYLLGLFQSFLCRKEAGLGRNATNL